MYTCLATLRRWLGHPSCLFRPTVSPKAGPLIKTTLRLRHNNPLLANPRGFRIEDGDGHGRKSRSSPANESSPLTIRMRMRIFCQIMFPRRNTTWLPSSPSSYLVSPSRRIFPMHLTGRFASFQSNSPNTPTYSSFSPRASSKFLGFRPPTNGLPLHRSLSSSSRLHSRRFRKIL